jgi:hypothetical protein
MLISISLTKSWVENGERRVGKMGKKEVIIGGFEQRSNMK